MGLTLDEAKVLLDFLDKVPLVGHQERENMNVIVRKIVENKTNRDVTNEPS